MLAPGMGVLHQEHPGATSSPILWLQADDPCSDFPSWGLVAGDYKENQIKGEVDNEEMLWMGEDEYLEERWVGLKEAWIPGKEGWRGAA